MRLLPQSVMEPLQNTAGRVLKSPDSVINILVPHFTGFGLIASLINPFSNDTPVIRALRQHLIHHSDDCRFNE